MPSRDEVELKDALESIENLITAARDYADNVYSQNLGLQNDVEGLQAANKSLVEENRDLRLDADAQRKGVESLNRACDELRSIVAELRGKEFQARSDIKRLQNKLVLAEEHRVNDKEALVIGRVLYGLLQINPLGGRDLITAFEHAVRHVAGDDLPPIQHFGVGDKPNFNAPEKSDPEVQL